MGSATICVVSHPSHSLADELWHAHILDSKAYAHFCHEHYGVYVHHESSYEESHAFHKPAFKASLLGHFMCRSRVVGCTSGAV